MIDSGSVASKVTGSGCTYQNISTFIIILLKYSSYQKILSIIIL